MKKRTFNMRKVVKLTESDISDMVKHTLDEIIGHKDYQSYGSRFEPEDDCDYQVDMPDDDYDDYLQGEEDEYFDNLGREMRYPAMNEAFVGAITESILKKLRMK